MINDSSPKSFPILTGAEVITKSLERFGVSTVFSLAGGAHTYLLDAFEKAGITIVGSRHESACVASAEGYARFTNSLGISCIIEPQGVPSSIAGITNARYACSPVVVLVSRLPDRWHDAQDEVFYSEESMYASVAKWARVVPSLDRLSEFVDAACREALSGRPGPVVLTLSRDLYVQTVESDAVLDAPPPPQTKPVPDPSDMGRLLEDLKNAKQPLCIAGAGALKSGAGVALRSLSHGWNIPVLGKAQGRGLVPEDHQLGFSWGFGNPAARQADFVFVLGSRLLTHENFGLPPYFAADAKIAKVDIHAEELNRSRWVHHPFHADCSAFVHLLVAGLKDQNIKPWPVPGWISDALQPRRDTLKDVLGSLEGKLHPLTICQTVADTVGDDAVVGVDGGYPNNWMNLTYRAQKDGGFNDLYPLGQMGTCTPITIGAAAAAKEQAEKDGTAQRQVVLVTGDGSFGYYLTNLSEAVRAGLKLTVVVLNDSAWGSELNIQVHDKIGRPVNTRLGPQDFSLVARGFGCKGVRVNALDDFRSAFNDALTADVPSVIDCDIDVSDALIAHDKPDLITLGFKELTLEAKQSVEI